MAMVPVLERRVRPWAVWRVDPTHGRPIAHAWASADGSGCECEGAGHSSPASHFLMLVWASWSNRVESALAFSELVEIFTIGL